MSIGFTQLRAFHAVAERGGFTAAAQALGISQPTVTTQVKELETSYGVELFVRKGRRVELTETGAALFDVARRIMSFRDQAHEVLAAHGRFDTGHLRMATVGPFHATEIIAAFRREYPKIKISTVLGNSERTLKHLVDFDADVAILAHAADDPRVEMVPYRVHRVVVFVNGEHPWFHRASVKMAELADQPFVLRERGSTTRRAFELALREQGLTIEPVFEIDSREGVWKAVERGLGISVVADFEFVAHPNLRALEIEDRTIKTEYRIAYLRDRGSAPLLRAFLKVVEELKRHYGDGSA